MRIPFFSNISNSFWWRYFVFCHELLYKGTLLITILVPDEKKIKSVLWVCATRYPRTWSFSLEKGKFFKVSCSETENWVSSWACVLKITRCSKRLVSKNFENQFRFFKLPAIIESIASAERNWTVVFKLRMCKCLLASFNRSWVILKIPLSLFECKQSSHKGVTGILNKRTILMRHYKAVWPLWYHWMWNL